LFPNYVFLRLFPEQQRVVQQSKHVASLLTVSDQSEFESQLKDILIAVDNDMPIQLAPEISEGHRVRIKAGPLRGVEGTVEKRTGSLWVVLRLDFISQAAAVKVDATDLELS
jgi:transcription antitermination factor NusG